MSTIKADALTTKSDNTDLTITGHGSGVPNIEAGFKVGGTAGVPAASIRDDAITSAKIADDAVVTAAIADDAITLATMASGTDGVIITYDASGNPVHVGPGTDGQVLTSTGSGSPPAFEAAPSGKVKQVVTASSTSVTSLTNVGSMTDVPGVSINITPTSSSNKIILMGQFNFRSHESYCYGQIVRRVGGSDAIPTGWIGDSDGSRVQAAFGNNYRHTGEGNGVVDGPIQFVLTDTNHSTTSQITYQLQYRLNSANGNTMYFGRSHNDTNDNTTGRSPRFNFTVMEVE